MAIFKTYDGDIIEDFSHDHKVEDTQATRKLIAAGATELFSTSTAVLTYYSTTLTPVIETEVVGNRNILVFSANNSDINGNIVLKMSTSTPLLTTKEYLLVLEPIEDSNTKTNIISMNFGTIAPYNFKNATFISEDIIRPVINYGTKITYMYKIRPQQNINSIIVYLYTISKITGTNKKQLFKISLREIEYQEQISTAIVTKEETGFMSAEDKNKLEKINTLSNYIESKLGNALFYAKIEPPKEQILNISNATGGGNSLVFNLNDATSAIVQVASGFSSFNGKLTLKLESNTIIGKTYKLKVSIIDYTHNVLFYPIMSGDDTGAGSGTWTSESDTFYILEFVANKSTDTLTLFSTGFYIMASNITSQINIAKVEIYSLE